jgi:hypothetical protein
MISPSCFLQGLFLSDLVRLDAVIKSRGEAPAALDAAGSVRKWADLMATGWTVLLAVVGNSVAAYGQFFMAANTSTSRREQISASTAQNTSLWSPLYSTGDHAKSWGARSYGEHKANTKVRFVRLR